MQEIIITLAEKFVGVVNGFVTLMWLPFMGEEGIELLKKVIENLVSF